MASGPEGHSTLHTEVAYMSASVSYVCLSRRKLLDSAGGSRYVKLLTLLSHS